MSDPINLLTGLGAPGIIGAIGIYAIRALRGDIAAKDVKHAEEVKALRAEIEANRVACEKERAEANAKHESMLREQLARERTVSDRERDLTLKTISDNTQITKDQTTQLASVGSELRSLTQAISSRKGNSNPNIPAVR